MVDGSNTELDDRLAGGERIGCIPRDVPGPYRLFLGMLQHSGKRKIAG